MDPQTLLYLLGAIGTAIAAAVTAMWKKVREDHDAVVKRCERLEAKDDSRDSDVAEMKSTLAVFQACPTDNCGARESLRRAETFNLKQKTP